MREYSSADKLKLIAWLFFAGAARVVLDAFTLYYLYASGRGAWYGVAWLFCLNVLWQNAVAVPWLKRVKVVFSGELSRGDYPNVGWKDLAFALAAARARKGGAK